MNVYQICLAEGRPNPTFYNHSVGFSVRLDVSALCAFGSLLHSEGSWTWGTRRDLSTLRRQR